MPGFYLKTKVLAYLKGLSSYVCVTFKLRLRYVFVFRLTRFFSKILSPPSVFVLFRKHFRVSAKAEGSLCSVFLESFVPNTLLC